VTAQPGQLSEAHATSWRQDGCRGGDGKRRGRRKPFLYLLGRRAATANKTTFTPDEWRKLLESPILAGHAVTAADPSGLWGQLKEKLSARLMVFREAGVHL